MTIYIYIYIFPNASESLDYVAQGEHVGQSWASLAESSTHMERGLVGSHKWLGTLGWQVAKGGVAASGAPFMVPLVCTPYRDIIADGGNWRCSPPGSLLSILSMSSTTRQP